MSDEQCAGDDVCDPQRNECVPAHCVNGIHDEEETDVDCGGVCPPCDVGQVCLEGGDCLSGVCEDGICQAPRCGDGVVHEGEECDDGNDDVADGWVAGPVFSLDHPSQYAGDSYSAFAGYGFGGVAFGATPKPDVYTSQVGAMTPGAGIGMTTYTPLTEVYSLRADKWIADQFEQECR